MSSMADRISTLPDDVLCHVLSYLPTKHAVATSVLSKRWTRLWRSVLALDFSNTKVKDREANFRFNEFVNSVLVLRDAAHSIKSLRLDIKYEYDHLDLGFTNTTKWVNDVTQRRVEYLHLKVNAMFGMPNLPVSILSCRTLVVLKFYGFSVEGFSSVGLPSLKILHFKDIRCAKLGQFLLLLAGSPMLEALRASRIVFESEDPLAYGEYKSLSLSKLTRADMDCCYCHFPLKALSNVESLRIEIDKMYCRNDDIPIFHNLTHLYLFSLNCDWHLLVEMLKNCPKLQNLGLDEATVDGVRTGGQENWVDPEFVPQCLSLHLRTCTLGNFLGLRGELLLARYILKNARVLQTMTIWSSGSLVTERILSSCPRASATCQLSVY